jgi:hypothetical protein
VTIDSPVISPAVLDRIRSEYVEMPDLCLTLSQAQRLLALGDDVCHAALENLVEHKFLTHSAAGSYVRATSR